MPAFNCFGSPGDVQNGILPLFLLSPAAALAVRLALVRMPHFSLSTAAAARAGRLARVEGFSVNNFIHTYFRAPHAERSKMLA